MIRYVACALTGSLLLSLLMLFGCTLRSAPTVNYFSLLTLEQLGETASVAAHHKMQLGVGPVVIPDNLKRSQIVTRQHGNQFEFDEFNRWAGVLEKDIEAVIGDNLGVLLGVENIGFFPWQPHFSPSYRVVIEIQRLDGSLGGEAVLDARWTVLGSDGKQTLAGARSVFRRPSTEPGYAGLVKAESQVIVDFCKVMAEAIDRVVTK